MLNHRPKKLYLNLISLFSIIVALFFCASIGAQDAYEETISLLVGQIRIMSLDSPTRVSIANPQIADISSIAEKEIILVGKAAGNTTLTVWDKLGERSFIIRVFSEDLNRLKQEIDELLSKLEMTTVTSQVNEAQAKIILMGKIQEDKKKIFDKAIKPYENKILNLVSAEEKNPLVLIDVEILEIGKNDLDELGINWSDALTFTESPTSRTGTLSELVRITEWSRDVLTFKLNFLKTEGRARTLSRPKLACVSGKTATFVVGGEIPITQSTTTQTTTTAAVSFKSYGIKLNIEPTVKSNEDINIKLTTEISDVDWSHTVSTSLGNIPAFVTRSATTELYLKAGQTIFLAGLLKNKDSKNLDKVPGLADIPILGALFRSKRFQLDQTELVISLTPSIMKEGGPEKLEEPRISQPLPERPQGPVVEKEISKEAQSDPLSQYTNVIKKKISEAASYPAIAEESRWEGEVRVSLHVLGDGNLDEVLLIKPSGINLLDEAALTLVKNQAPFPAFPAEIQEKDLWIDVTLVYQPE